VGCIVRAPKNDLAK